MNGVYGDLLRFIVSYNKYLIAAVTNNMAMLVIISLFASVNNDKM